MTDEHGQVTRDGDHATITMDILSVATRCRWPT